MTPPTSRPVRRALPPGGDRWRRDRRRLRSAGTSRAVDEFRAGRASMRRSSASPVPASRGAETMPPPASAAPHPDTESDRNPANEDAGPKESKVRGRLRRRLHRAPIVAPDTRPRCPAKDLSIVVVRYNMKREAAWIPHSELFSCVPARDRRSRRRGHRRERLGLRSEAWCRSSSVRRLNRHLDLRRHLIRRRHQGCRPDQWPCWSSSGCSTMSS